NARRSDLIALLCKTDLSAEPRHKGISIILVEKGEGFTISQDLSKLGYKGVETCELNFENLRQPQSQLLGETEGVGFNQRMKGLGVGGMQLACRSRAVGQAAPDDGVRHSEDRESSGKPIRKHQSVANKLAMMATKLEAARQLVLHAARTYDSGAGV